MEATTGQSGIQRPRLQGAVPKPLFIGKECDLYHNQIFNDTLLDDFLSDSFLNAETNGLLHIGPYDEYAFSKDQPILLPHRVHVFSLKSRRWGPSKFPYPYAIANVPEQFR